MTFEQEIHRLRTAIEMLTSVMAEAEQLEEQKLSVLGFDQDNVLEDEIQYRFRQHTNTVEQIYATIVRQFPTEMSTFQTDGINDDDSALQAFRTGQATLGQFWDLFGEI